MPSRLGKLCAACLALALAVIVLGAYVRLSDAGLSCPDWPGCYGRILVPDDSHEIALAEARYPHTPVEVGKAWKEMAHRYLAGLLGLGIVLIAALSLRRRAEPGTPRLLPVALVALVVFQALLGMWTVTLLLKPMVVTAHLLGGMATAALLGWLTLRHLALGSGWIVAPLAGLTAALAAGLGVLVVQIGLGGWTSANYAALACPDLPLCNAELWPTMDLAAGFQIRRELGLDLSGGRISHEGLVAIHFVHRLGALLTFAMLTTLGVWTWRRGPASLRRPAAVLLALLGVQVLLGAATVLEARPLLYAVAHNANAALLLLSVVWLLYLSRARPETLLECRAGRDGAVQDVRTG